MALWIKIVVLLATVSSAVWAEKCVDPCFCPANKIVNCNNRGLTQPPSGYWPQVTTLYLAINQISVLHKRSLTGFPNLITLNMESNSLRELDLETFSVLPFLSYLNLGRNSITTVAEAPPGVTLGKLSSLSLFSNSIFRLDPNVFSSAPVLSSLILDDNPLTAKERTSFLNHPTLSELYMLESPLTLQSGYLGPEFFKGLPKLQILILVSSSIKSISGAFTNNPELYLIDLRQSLISEITAGTFDLIDNLKTLRLSNSPLQLLDVSAVANVVPSGGSIFIHDTPLACSCGFEGLYWWAKGKGVYLNARCSGKEPCSFTRLSNLTLIHGNEDS